MDDKLKAKLEEALSSIGMLNNEINALESQLADVRSVFQGVESDVEDLEQYIEKADHYINYDYSCLKMNKSEQIIRAITYILNTFNNFNEVEKYDVFIKLNIDK